MNLTTRGIALDYVKYGEHGIILRLYTLHLGLHSYLIRGVRRGKRGSAGMYQPLAFLDVVVQHQPNRKLHYIKEAQPLPQAYPYDDAIQVHKLLLVQVLKRVLPPYDQPKEDKETAALFDFIFHSISVFHTCSSVSAWVFVSQFMVKLSAHLGIFLSGSALQAACRVYAFHEAGALASWVGAASTAPYGALLPSPVARLSVYFLLTHFGTHFGAEGAMEYTISALKKI